VVRRLYFHNFRCFVNFTLPIYGKSSILLVGNNGSGKTTVAKGLEVLQKIARGTNRVAGLVSPKDFTNGRADAPMRFEIEVELATHVYNYSVSFELPVGFKELRVRDERLAVDGNVVYSRELAQVHITRAERQTEAEFGIDWHLVALPIVQQQSKNDPIFILKDWLSRMLILRPIPSLMTGESNDETLQPSIQLTNFAAWFAGLLAQFPSSYSKIDTFLKQLWPDLNDIRNPSTSKDSKSLIFQFAEGADTVEFAFDMLSDGEKCFVVCALVLVANQAYGPLLCFWDEPDNFLAASEISSFVLALRKSFWAGGQFIATSHNPEAIRSFSDDNTILLSRHNHLEPAIARTIDELKFQGDLVSALVRGDVE